MKKFIRGFDETDENAHYYVNEDNQMVWLPRAHKERGYCCGNGCLHCPY